ncbi:hypothetical protein CPB85DRAFT_1437511 [Mucidula mucida]|nr:hypothetical protein CPB85DRAFT_1437511 [Mucidula mucida]
MPFRPQVLGSTKDWRGKRKSDVGKQTHGQIAMYASITMFLSYRKHFMSVVVFSKSAKLIFWDRCSAVVSSHFNYQEGDEDKTLFKFYLCFSQLTAKQCGHNPIVTVVLNNILDAKAALVQFRKYDRDMWHCNAQMKPHNNKMEPFIGIKVPEECVLRMTVKFDNSAKCFFIVPAPIFEDTCISPFLRLTRRSLAYDCSFTPTPGKEHKQLKKAKHGSLLFMKDYWREESSRMQPEAEI